MSEIEKYCAHFKPMNEESHAGNELYYCGARDLVLCDDAAVCFVCSEYKTGKDLYDDDVKKKITDYLRGKKRRHKKRWSRRKKKKTKKKTKKKSKTKKKEEEESEEEEDEEDDEENEDEEEEPKTSTKKSKSATEPKEISLSKNESEILEIIKSFGDDGITQLDIKDETNLQSSKISKILINLKDAGLISKEKHKVKDKKTGKTKITNMLKII